MADEKERKYLIINNDWRALDTIDILELKQGYVPPDNKKGTRLYINFPTGYENIAQITIENEAGIFTFDGIREEIKGDFAKLQSLPAYNKETSELTLAGPTEARVRIQKSLTEPDKAIFAVKDYDLSGVGREGRKEFEVYVNMIDAEHILKCLTENNIEKRRHVIPYAGYKWEVDEYLGKDAGYVSADVEVSNEAEFDTMQKLPSAGKDISNAEDLRNQAIAEFGVPASYRINI